MDFWLSGSLSHELFLFSRWDSGYHEAFYTNFFSRWNSGYHGVFSRTFLFSRWNHGYHEALSRTLSFFTMESWLSRSLFTNSFFHMMESTKCMIWGKTLFIYITKSIYIGSASLKTLPLDLEPTLQGKEYSLPYSNVIAKKKANVFSPKSLIDS
jgi:hypothetical protein